MPAFSVDSNAMMGIRREFRFGSKHKSYNGEVSFYTTFLPYALMVKFRFGNLAHVGLSDPLFTVVQSTLMALSHEIHEGHIDSEPAEKQLLHFAKINGATQVIKEAMKPKVASFLLSGEGFSIDKYCIST